MTSLRVGLRLRTEIAGVCPLIFSFSPCSASEVKSGFCYTHTPCSAQARGQMLLKAGAKVVFGRLRQEDHKFKASLGEAANEKQANEKSSKCVSWASSCVQDEIPESRHRL